MNVVDLLVVVFAIAFALAGLRQGFIVSIISFAGFVAGGLVGLVAMPALLQSRPPGVIRSLIGLGGVVLFAVVVQAIAGWLGSMLRNRLVWRPARRVDALGGAVVGVVSVLVAAWLLGGVLTGVGNALPLAEQARTSRLLAAVDRVMPGTPDAVFSAFGNLLDTTGFPQVFTDLTQERPAPVRAPDSGVAAQPAVRNAAGTTVKVIGAAPSCSRQIEGSGFVFAPGHVMTNAHVVAGVPHPVVYVGGSGTGYRAVVVEFDPNVDVAVLWVPGLTDRSLAFAPGAAPGTDSAAVGYPGDGPLTISPARVRDTLTAVGQNIYGGGRVVRQVYALRVQVHPGNSGGPLLDTSGRVLGVVFAASRTDPETGYALTSAQVAAAARAGASAVHAVSTGPCA